MLLSWVAVAVDAVVAVHVGESYSQVHFGPVRVDLDHVLVSPTVHVLLQILERFLANLAKALLMILLLLLLLLLVVGSFFGLLSLFASGVGQIPQLQLPLLRGGLVLVVGGGVVFVRGVKRRRSGLARQMECREFPVLGKDRLVQ